MAASSANYLTFLFLLLVVSSLQVHARDSHFFSKFNHYNSNTNTETNSNNNAKETQVPQKEVTSAKEGDESSLTTETQNGYGLFGPATTQIPTTTSNEASYTYSNLPQKNPTAEYNDERFEYNKVNNNKNYGYETKQYSLSDTRYQGNVDTDNSYYRNNKNNNNDAYQFKQQDMGNTRYQDNGNNYGNGYQFKQQGMSNGRYKDEGNNYNNGYQANKQGMSDTRFMENGKYFYDVDNENFDPNEYHFRGMDTRNQYNGNNENSYNFNSMDLMNENEESQQESEP